MGAGVICMWSVVASRAGFDPRRSLAGGSNRQGGQLCNVGRRTRSLIFEPRRFGRRDRGARGGGQDGAARKWRRNRLKRLNPRPETVWARKPRTTIDSVELYKCANAGTRLSKIESCH